MPTKRIVQDPDFGRIEIRTNRRARNITMRPKDDGLHVTVPPYTSLASVLKAIGRIGRRFVRDARSCVRG